MTTKVSPVVYSILLAAISLYGQSVGGSLSGKVTSAEGAAVPNAAVTITNVNTNASQRALTGSDGAFTISGLAPGTYRVDIESSGYKRSSQTNIELTAAGSTPINITLLAGSAADSVQIEGSAPVIQTGDAEIGVGFGTRMVREIPVIDRNHQQLTGLQSGVTPPEVTYDLARDPNRNRVSAINGQNPFVNRSVIDGVDNQEPFRGIAARVQPEESIQQFNVSTSNLTAEKGYTGAGYFANVSRAGTNDWHGSLYEFYSGNVVRTRGPFNIAGNPDPKFVSNQFGTAFGGPVVRDKTFFFGSYEGFYQNGSNTQVTTVPTPAMIGGNFTGVPGLVIYNPSGFLRTPFPGGIIQSSLLNQQSAAIAQLFPAPNVNSFSNNLVANVPFRNHSSKFDARIDQHFSDRTSAFVRYGFTNAWTSESSPVGDAIGGGTRGRLLNNNAVIGVAHAFTPSLTTDFRMGYNRYDQRINALATATNLGIDISGFAPLGPPAYAPEHAVDNTFDWAWSWGLHTSMHNLKWGVDIRRIRSDGFTDNILGNTFGANGTAFFGPGATMSATGPAISPFGLTSNSFAAFLLGAPVQVGALSNALTPTIRQTQYGVWLGDTVQFMRIFTLDLGLRYEIYSPLEPSNAGGAASFDPTTNTFNFAGVGTQSMHFNRYDLNNVAPRIGLSVRATPKTVFRAGYAWNYFQMPYRFSGLFAPMFGSVNGVGGSFNTVPIPASFNATAPDLTVNGAPAGNIPAVVAGRDIDTPYVQQVHAQVQQEFYWGTVLSAGYVGAFARHLPYFEELNAAFPAAGLAGLPFSNFGRTSSTPLAGSGLNSNYNSLQINLNKRFAHGLSFVSSYTWSKALGYTDANQMLLNPFDFRSNYGPLDYDRQSVLSIGHLWELPFGRHGGNIASTLLGGWQWNGVFSWTTGSPVTVTADPTGCNCPNGTVFANLNGNPYLNSGVAILNPAAFSAPAFGQFGTLGRGSLRAPGFKNYDMSLFKDFRVRERFNLELRGEVYNLTNTPHFAPPITNFSSAAFGQTVSTLNGGLGRQINLGLRLMF